MLTVVVAQCTAENAEVNTNNMPIMGQAFTDAGGCCVHLSDKGLNKQSVFSH